MKSTKHKTDKFPVTIFAYAILLDNKIENWKVGYDNFNHLAQFTSYWRTDRLNDYRLEKICWVCKNQDEVNKVFEKLSENWFKNWKHSDDYMFMRAY